jgi:hypothetical protein
MSLRERFKQSIDRWSGPLGPFGSLEQNESEMRELGSELTTKAQIDEIVSEIASWADDDTRRIVEANNFCVELRSFGKQGVLSESLIQHMIPSGPASLVAIWEAEGSPEQTPLVLKKIDYVNAGPRLAVALTDALWTQGGDGAVEVLEQMRSRAEHPDVIDELDKALSSIKSLV